FQVGILGFFVFGPEAERMTVSAAPDRSVSTTSRERTDADGHGRKASRPTAYTEDCSSRRPEPVSHRANPVRHGGRILEARRGAAASAAHAKARAGSFFAHQDGQRAVAGHDWLSRAAQRFARPGQRGYPFSSERDTG